ncbi:MAG: enoyl-CoA hydratase/isomerase family protein [Actinomycetota bacterium]
MTDPLVLRTDTDGVAVVELNRPHRKNAMTGPLMAALADTMEAVARDESVEAVVFCGAGGAFCSGLDLDEYNADPPPDWLADAPTVMRRAHVSLAACPVPIVVALERYAINGGAALALAGDLIVVGEESWLQVGEVKLGMAAPNNLAWLAPRYPLSTIMQIVVPGERLPGPRLRELGVAYDVVPDPEVRSRAEALGAQLAGYPRGAGRMMKQGVLRVTDHTEHAAWFEDVGRLAARADGRQVRPGRM